MANYFARKAGNINATDVWATTPTGTAADVWSTFTSSDVLHSNNFAITVNVDTTVGEVRNDNSNSATAGGSFTLQNGITLTANAFAGSTNTACVIFSVSAGESASLVGNCTGGTATGIGGSCATIAGSGTANITGNLTGGTNGSNGATNTGGGQLNITGNCTGGSGTLPHGCGNRSTGTTNITGNCTGSATAAAFGAQNLSTGTMTIVGSCFGGNNGVGAQNTSTGILNVIRAVGNDWGIGATGMVAAGGVDSANVGAQTRVEELEYGSLGMAPTSGAVSCPDETTNVCLVHRLSSTKKTLIDAASVSGALPAASDVRSGVAFNVGNTTGTCAVPAAGSVALGVAVDNTTGTAVLTPAAVWDALTSGMTTAGSIGARLKNAATLDSTGQQLADALSPVP
jgi:fibronectin-binding autotransporter adhesin